MKGKIIRLLADFLGIEPADIADDDSLTEDLHMTPSDLGDFAEILRSAGIDVNPTEMAEVETVGELYEKYSESF